MARSRSVGGRRPRRMVANEDKLENGHREVDNGSHVREEGDQEVEEDYEEVEEDTAVPDDEEEPAPPTSPGHIDHVNDVVPMDQGATKNEEVEEDAPVTNTVEEEPAPPTAPDQKDDVNDAVPMDEGATKNEKVEEDARVPDTVKEEPAPSAAPDRRDDANDAIPMDEGATKNEEVEEDVRVSDTAKEEPAPSAAPDQKDDVNVVVSMDDGLAKNEEVEADTSVPETVKDEPACSAAPGKTYDVNAFVPMDEGSVKNEKKRGREEETAVENESEKTIKVAKTETEAVEDVVNSTATGRAEDEAAGGPENGDGVEVVEGAVIGDNEPGKTKRLKKRKIAMIVAYCGANYQGMQRNPGAITIEGELEQALYRAGAITKDNFGVPRKVDWMRAARTDKGVSAVGQIVSGQFIIEPDGFVDRVNSFLPRDIVLLGYKRVTASFNAKKLCDKRRYEYVIPTYCFDPRRHLDRETVNALKAEDKDELVENDAKEVEGVESLDGQKGVAREKFVDGETDLTSRVKGKPVYGEAGSTSELKEEPVDVEASIQTENKEEVKSLEGETAGSDKVKEEHADGDTVDSSWVKEEPVNRGTVISTMGKVGVKPEDGDTSIETEVKEKGLYKFDEAELNRLDRILARYKGTHNYHNFTARTQAEDPSAHRFIISFEVEDIITVDGIEFVRLHVIGQSFMLHQIRKMVGLAVAIMRGAAPESVMDFALRKDTKFNVPMAPELGLFLEECYYSSYNNKFKSSHEELSLKDYKDVVNDFKRNVIYPHIAATEARDEVFPLWLHGINDRHFPDFVAAREGIYKPGNRNALKAA